MSRKSRSDILALAGMPVSDRQGSAGVSPATHTGACQSAPQPSNLPAPSVPSVVQNPQSILLRFLSIHKAPFTLRFFVSTTGEKPISASLLLIQGVQAGILRLIQDTPDLNNRVYLAVPPPKPKYGDFTPNPAKLQTILNAMLPGKPYLPETLLQNGIRMGIRTLQRYLQYLTHLGCLSRSTLPAVKRPLSLYRKTGKPLPERLPRYFATCSPTWNGVPGGTGVSPVESISTLPPSHLPTPSVSSVPSVVKKK